MGSDLQQEILRIKPGTSVVPLRPAGVPKAGSEPLNQTAASLTPVKSVDSVLRCRYELKYLVCESKAKAIEGYIKNRIDLDKYSKKSPGGVYPITSLYLDSHNLKLCRETLDGHKNRFKLRIRTYDIDDPNSPGFFEIKRRLNNIIIKDRVCVKHGDIEHVLHGLSMPSGYCPADQQTIRQFRLYVNTINAAPVINIRYMRQAYEGDNKVRITFDRQLKFKTCSKVEGLFQNYGWQDFPDGSVIVEIKFTDRYPSWLNQMVRVLELYQQSVSKYASSLQRSYKLPFCAPRLPIRMY
jgi:hypothetical protein